MQSSYLLPTARPHFSQSIPGFDPLASGPLLVCSFPICTRLYTLGVLFKTRVWFCCSREWSLQGLSDPPGPRPQAPVLRQVAGPACVGMRCHLAPVSMPHSHAILSELHRLCLWTETSISANTPSLLFGKIHPLKTRGINIYKCISNSTEPGKIMSHTAEM